MVSFSDPGRIKLSIRMGKKNEVVVAFDCSQFPSLSNKPKTNIQNENQLLKQNKEAQEKAIAISNLKTRDLFHQVQHSIDDLRANSLVGKQRRRFLEQVAIREGSKRLENAPKVPSKILAGMRKKAKKRETRAREENKAMGGAPSSHLLTSGTIRVQKYEMRNKEQRKVKDRERGLMLSHALKKRETQKPKPFRPPK